MSSTTAKNQQGLRQLGNDAVNETSVWTVDIVVITGAKLS